MNTRTLEPIITQDLARKMVFLTGPRQVGKTTLAKRIIASHHGTYLLYDDPEDRTTILKREYLREKWVCLDEFHKFERWKSYLKGVYDKYRETLHMLITGSARLDVFQKSGDSLLGRYYLHHLHPLTLAEMNTIAVTVPDRIDDATGPLHGLEELLRFGGFPEPLYRQSETEHRRWTAMRRHLLIQEDMRELTHIHFIGLVEQLLLLLPERIGSLISYRSLAEDIRVSAPTIQNWLAIFERLFIVYKILPYTTHIQRSLQKQPKYYMWDWSEIPSESVRFENCIASHLWKAVTLWNDCGLVTDAGLHFIRDNSGREVDFIVTKQRQPWFLVEAKLADEKVSPSLLYFSKKFNIPAVQVVAKENVVTRKDNVSVISANRWLGHLV